MTVTELDDLVQTYMTGLVPHVRWAVQRRDKAVLAELLEPLDVIQLRTLIVVLAKQTPTMRSRPDDGVVDDVAIARAIAGARVELTRPEQLAAVRVLKGRGHTPAEIANRLHTNVSTVRKLLQEVAA